MTIYACISKQSIQEIEEKYKASTYAEFKEDLAEIVASEIEPIQKKYNALIQSKELDIILDQGRDYANFLAQRKITKIYQKIGIGRKR